MPLRPELEVAALSGEVDAVMFIGADAKGYSTGTVTTIPLSLADVAKATVSLGLPMAEVRAAPLLGLR